MISNTTVRQTYVGDGSNQTFAIPFQVILGDDEVLVILRDETDLNNITETEQTLGVDYTLTGAIPPGIPFNTNVQMTVAPTATQKLIVMRKSESIQPTDYLETSEFPVDVVEEQLDKLTALVQELREQGERTPMLSIGSTADKPFELPEPVATTLWGWDADKDVFRYYTPVEIVETILGLVMLRANNLSDVSSVATSLDNLGIDPFKKVVNAVIANNQAVPADVTGLLVQGAAYTSAIIYYEINRATATDSKIAVGRLFLYRKPHTGNWFIDTGEWYGDDVVNPGGLTFSVNQIGADAQLQFTSDNLLGAGYDGKIKTSIKYFKV